MAERDTIAAIATGGGRAGIGVVRVSGPDCRAVAHAVLGRVPPPRLATLCAFADADGSQIDRGIVLFFPSPSSYTGEDVLELHAHGSRPILELLLERIIAVGARMARPGEFTERAFLEGRMDLAQAEAVADLVDASSRQAARAAQATLGGEFSRRVEFMVSRLIRARVEIEARLDFADEDIQEHDEEVITALLGELGDVLEDTLSAAVQGARLRDGMRAVLLGAPNVGKSSILNRLAQADLAIVTANPGTTRDVLMQNVRVGDVQLELVDTAGLHESRDEVERIGMQRARQQAELADLVVLVCDEREDESRVMDLPAGPSEVLVVYNKIDLSGRSSGIVDDAVYVSALTGEGFDDLIRALSRFAVKHLGEGKFSARQRHVMALRSAGESIASARSIHERDEGAELVADELRRAQSALGEINGTVTSDDLLGAIFSTFCIGK
jgi:tRNA modification GTPase